MPVSYLPLLFLIFAIVFPLLMIGVFGKRGLGIGIGLPGVVVLAFYLKVYLPSWVLRVEANRGDPAALYRLARWTENHGDELRELLPSGGEPDVIGGFRLLEKAAAKDYPPAVWLVGVRLKYGMHVPQPPDWKGPRGNVFPQPANGQKMIDRARKLGFKPPDEEETYYWTVYRKR